MAQVSKIQTQTAATPTDILARMAQIVQAHAVDVAPWALLGLSEFFDLVRGGNYIREPSNWRTQVLARPSLTISKAVPIVACANKAIILASWAELNKIPWRLVAVGRAPGLPPHHVFPEFFMGGEWRPVDGTYPWSVLFARKDYPVRVVFDPHNLPPALAPVPKRGAFAVTPWQRSVGTAATRGAAQVAR